jgi:putative flippase GtrA
VGGARFWVAVIQPYFLYTADMDRILQKYLSQKFLRYCTVGVSNKLLDFSCYFLLTRYLGFSGDFIYLAKGLSFLVASVNSFIWNRRFTFKDRNAVTWKQIARFYSIVGTNVTINIGVHFVNVHFLGIYDLLSIVIAATFSVLIGFLLIGRFVFKTHL